MIIKFTNKKSWNFPLKTKKEQNRLMQVHFVKNLMLKFSFVLEYVNLCKVIFNKALEWNKIEKSFYFVVSMFGEIFK